MTARRPMFRKWRYTPLGMDVAGPRERLRERVEIRVAPRAATAAVHLFDTPMFDAAAAAVGWLIHNTGDSE